MTKLGRWRSHGLDSRKDLCTHICSLSAMSSMVVAGLFHLELRDDTDRHRVAQRVYTDEGVGSEFCVDLQSADWLESGRGELVRRPAIIPQDDIPDLVSSVKTQQGLGTR